MRIAPEPVGDAADVAFLAEALRGATTVFTLTPPNFAAPSRSIAVDRFGSAVLAAIAAAGVRKVVNLSSAGASLPSGTGPIVGLYRNEQRLNSLADVDVMHLRAASFMENLMAKIGPMKQFGVFPDMMDGDVVFFDGGDSRCGLSCRRGATPTGLHRQVRHRTARSA